MTFIEDIADFLGLDEEWPVVLFFVGLSILFIGCILTIPLLSLQISFTLFILFSVIVIGAAFLLDSLIMNFLGMAMITRIKLPIFRWIIISIAIAGSVYGLYSMLVDIFNMQWANWGIKSFYSSMEPSSNPFAPTNKSVLDAMVFSKLVQVWKALIINVGSVVFYFIKNMLAPWSWISASVGIFRAL